MLFLPIFAEVTKLDDRYFGIVETVSGENLFFHGSTGISRGSFDELECGDIILALVGSDPKRPGNRRIVRWAPLNHVDWSIAKPENQAAWDAMRQARLGQHLQSLPSVLRPDWYLRVWGSKPAPPALEDDVLRDIVIAKIGRMKPNELDQLNLRSPFESILYSFLSRLEVAMWFVRTGEAETVEWERRAILAGKASWEADSALRLLKSGLPEGAGLLLWLGALRKNSLLPAGFADEAARVDGVQALLRYAEFLSDGQRDALLDEAAANGELRLEIAASRPDFAVDLAHRAALAFDLETDGKSIWQIGTASVAGKRLLFGRGGPEALARASATLRQQLSVAPIVVGHNIIKWDLPIVPRERGTPFATGLVWDTLLVGMLMDPAAPSHALGGAHCADKDAADALMLFRRQLERLPASFSAALLSDPPASSVALIERIAQALADIPFEPAPAPLWMTGAGIPDLPIIAPRHVIDDLAWALDIDVVEGPGADTLPIDLCVLDADALRADPEFDHESDPHAAVILALAERCAKASAALRIGVLPESLIEDSPGEAVRRAARSPKAPEKPGRRVCLMPMPPAGKWWDAFDGQSLRVLSWNRQACLLPPPSTRQKHVEQDPQDALLWEEEAKCWILPDPVADRLERFATPRRFGTVRLPDGAAVSPQRSSQTPPVKLVVPARKEFRMHSGGFDPGAYWADVIEQVAALAKKGEVRALLVGSSNSKKLLLLLEQALAEIGHGEVGAEHISRREHLRRAARTGGTVVLPMADWRQWQRFATAENIVLRPLVEALPVEEWHALEVEQPSQSISRTDIAARLSGTARKYLGAWLHESGLADAGVAPVILDPRAEELVRPLGHYFDVQAAPPAPPADLCRKVADALERLAVKRKEAPSDLAAMENFLVRHWQPPSGKGNEVKEFKPTQKSAMEVILRRQADVVVTLPTGERKSVLFQVPALCRGLCDRRLTLVLSPLKALMGDQVTGAINPLMRPEPPIIEVSGATCGANQ